MPAITHLLPVKNGEKFVAAAIESIYRNADVGDELLIVEDGSTDATLEIIKQVTSRPRCKTKFITTGGVGLIQALQLGVQNSSTSWIARWDVDDSYPDNRISIQREFLNEDIAAVFTDYAMFGDGKKFLGVFPSPMRPFATALSLLYSQQTAHPSVILNKAKLIQAGGYLQSDYPAEDLGLWVRLHEFGDLITVPQILLTYRLSKGSVSALKRDEILEKSKSVIQSLNLNRYKGLDIYAEIDFYAKTNNRTEREILYIRNLVAARRLGLVSISVITYFRFLLKCLKIRHIVAVLNMVRYTRRRKQFRESLT